MNQKQKIILIVSISIFLLYMGYTLLFEQKEKEEVIEQPPLIEKVEEEKKDTYKVDIKGQVDYLFIKMEQKKLNLILRKCYLITI